jgi:recombination protein RecT
MASELVIFENTLRPLAPRFEQALAGAVPVERLMRSIMVSVERNPKLLEANRQSLLNASMSAACLALEVDGVTGQAFFVPFKGQAQLIIGYKGMNTLAARSGFTVQGEVVREGDEFDFELGDKGFVRHKPKLVGGDRPIIAAWATASANNRPSIISVLSYDDILDIRKKSPGASRSDSPWNDAKIGFPAMASKSAKRRLSRAMPLNADPRFHLAAAMEEATEERGRSAWIDPQRGLQIEGETLDGPRIIHDQRSAQDLISPQSAEKAADSGASSSPSHTESAANNHETESERLARLDGQLDAAAKMGTAELEKVWLDDLTKDDRIALKAALQRRHKPTAAAADAGASTSCS